MSIFVYSKSGDVIRTYLEAPVVGEMQAFGGGGNQGTVGLVAS